MYTQPGGCYKSVADGLEGDEKTGANIILKALEAPLFHIVANAGLEGSVIVNKVKESPCRRMALMLTRKSYVRYD